MADNLKTIPAHFCAGLAQRAAVWEALPPAAQESFRSTCSELERLTVDLGDAKAQLQSLVDDIWAARFVDAAVCKTQLLQTVFPLVARRCQEQWDARRLSASAQRAASIYDLDSHLLEDIITRVIAAPSAAEPGQISGETDDVRLNQPLQSSCPHRVVARVCRSWEVIAYANRRTLTLTLTGPFWRGALALRVIERSALSSRLQMIEVLVPESRVSCGAELAALAAVLPRCAALNTVNICLEVGDPDRETEIPDEVLAALPHCAALTRLKFGSNDVVRLSGESTATLARTLLALERLECLSLDGIKEGEGAPDHVVPALEQHWSLQRLDCSYCFCQQDWASLLHSTRLVQLRLECCRLGGDLPTPREATPIDSQLAELSLLKVSLDEGDHLPLAASLAQLTKLSGLELDVMSEVIAGAISKLPALQALYLFCVEWVAQQWFELCDVVRHCTRIQCLSVYIKHTGSANEALVAEFHGAFAAASHLKSLSIKVHRSSSGGGLVGAVLDAVPAMRRLEVLCLDGQFEFGQLCKLRVQMCRSECLQRLCLKSCMLSEDERAALEACSPQVELVFA